MVGMLPIMVCADDVREIYLTTTQGEYKYQYIFDQRNNFVVEMEYVQSGSDWLPSRRIARAFDDDVMIGENHEVYTDAGWQTEVQVSFSYSGTDIAQTVERYYDVESAGRLLRSVTTSYVQSCNKLLPTQVVTQTDGTSNTVAYTYRCADNGSELSELIVTLTDCAAANQYSEYRLSFDSSQSAKVVVLDAKLAGEADRQHLMRFTSHLDPESRNTAYQTVENYKQTPKGMGWVMQQSAQMNYSSNLLNELVGNVWADMFWKNREHYLYSYSETLAPALLLWQEPIHSQWRDMLQVNYTYGNNIIEAEVTSSFWGRDIQADMPFEIDFLKQHNLPQKKGRSLKVVYGSRLYTSLPAVTAATTVSAYPNPVINTLYVDLERADNTTIGVYDLTGKLLLSTKATATHVSLDLNDLSDGIYLLRTSGDNSSTVKIIKGN